MSWQRGHGQGNNVVYSSRMTHKDNSLQRGNLPQGRGTRFPLESREKRFQEGEGPLAGREDIFQGAPYVFSTERGKYLTRLSV